MEFRIASTFTDSLGKLTGQEQKVVKTTAFELQLNPANPGLQFHRLDRTRDPNFWSLRASRDIRLIVHKTQASLLLCYVGHHDAAYAWAARRKIERHPKTGAAQLVEVRERVQEIPVYKHVDAVAPDESLPLLFAEKSDDELLGYGVPPEWMDDVRQADEDSLLTLAEHLPQEAAEALLELAVGGTPQVVKPIPADADPFEHPDALHRFRVMMDVNELKLALDYPWEKWTIFLHPAQRQLVERDYNGPARISGSAGTGKTIVALHRAVYLARQHPDATVLLAAFSNALANALKVKLARLVGDIDGIRNRIQIHTNKDFAHALYSTSFGAPSIASADQLRKLLHEIAANKPDHRFSDAFLLAEWTEVVDAWQVDSWESYRDVPRLGRKTRVGGKQRERLWTIFEKTRAEIATRQLVTWPMVYERLAAHLVVEGEHPFDFAVIDESQDLDAAELRFLAALGTKHPDSLFFVGDLGQRIFQQPFSWESLGVKIRGRSHTLNINYRTSHQIRQQVDRLLPIVITDVDGNAENRRGTQSVINGPPPTIEVSKTAEEAKAVGEWVATRLNEGISPQEIGVFVRAEPHLPRALEAVQTSGTKAAQLDDKFTADTGSVAICTMHLAKGLEFRAVAVMTCDDEVVPLQSRIETVAGFADLEDVYNTERQLLYVACTRAREHLLITGLEPTSEFLDDLER